MNEDSDDRRSAAELTALKEEVADVRSPEELARVAHELLYRSLEHGSVDPDPICHRIAVELEADPLQYRSLLDVWDGNVRGAAAMVRDHMVELGRLGINWTMRRAMAHADELAAMVIHQPGVVRRKVNGVG